MILPEHEFQPNYVGWNGEDVYNEHKCEICKYIDQLSKEPKMAFLYINTDMENFYLGGSVPTMTLHKAIVI